MSLGGGEATRAYRPAKEWHEYELGPFEALPPEIDAAQLHLLSSLVDEVVSNRCLGVLAELGLPVPGHLDLLADDMALSTGVVEERAFVFHWMLRRLHAQGMLRGDPAEEVTDIDPGAWTDDELEAAARSHAPALGTTFELIDHAAAHYARWLRGEVQGNQILFTRRAADLWAGYFQNENVPYGATNRLAAAAVDAATGERPLRVLEVGGGCGSAAEALLDRTAERVAAYRFTEVSPVFLRRGRAHLAARFPEVPLETGTLDLNRPLAEQGVEAESFDVVFAVNVLHAVRDLLGTLGALRGALAEGGVLGLGELVRPTPGFPLSHELAFQLTREFQDFVPEPGIRPKGGFLHWRCWRPALERAGFGRVHTVPELEAAIASYPTYAMAAFVAERDP